VSLSAAAVASVLDVGLALPPHETDASHSEKSDKQVDKRALGGVWVLVLTGGVGRVVL
jgi:hypothetical protein